MKKRITDYIILTILSLLSIILGYGLNLISDGDNYFYGIEISMIFILLVFTMIIVEDLNKTNQKGVLELYKKFYIKTWIFPVLIISISPLLAIFNQKINHSNIQHFILPIMIIILSVDFVADKYVYINKKDNNNYSTLRLFIKLIFYPLIYISVISLLGEFTNIGISLLIIIALVVKLLFKAIVLTLLKEKVK